mmetsp:Transcript_14119/g.29209  ORF Transcript_14119/g.29209 Transcript_14119/m.29209 type:complete len:219 (+) Transcript_14119:420-1076(+)
MIVWEASIRKRLSIGWSKPQPITRAKLLDFLPIWIILFFQWTRKIRISAPSKWNDSAIHSRRHRGLIVRYKFGSNHDTSLVVSNLLRLPQLLEKMKQLRHYPLTDIRKRFAISARSCSNPRFTPGRFTSRPGTEKPNTWWPYRGHSHRRTKKDSHNTSSSLVSMARWDFPKPCTSTSRHLRYAPKILFSKRVGREFFLPSLPSAVEGTHFVTRVTFPL